MAESLANSRIILRKISYATYRYRKGLEISGFPDLETSLLARWQKGIVQMSLITMSDKEVTRLNASQREYLKALKAQELRNKLAA